MAPCLLALVSLLALLLSPAHGVPSSLRLVHVLYRHGARTPTHQYVTDPHQGVWTQGLGHLTNEGKTNQLELGRFLRRRYGGFLPALYHRNHTWVRSTDVDRTLMSALANLAGLYPPQDRDVWDPGLPWQPIPVHTESAQNDLLMRSYENCAAYQAEEKRVRSSDRLQKLGEEYSDVYRHLTQKSGEAVQDLAAIAQLFTTLSIEDANNMTVPDWARVVLQGRTEPLYPNLLSHLTDVAFQLHGATRKSQRLGGGPLVKDMVTHMSDLISGTLEPPSRRFFMYSGHDTTLAFVMPALRVFNNRIPPFAACLMVELHQDVDSGFFVNIFYRNDTMSTDPHQLQVEGCDIACPWERFLDLMKEVMPGDIAEECKANADDEVERLNEMMM